MLKWHDGLHSLVQCPGLCLIKNFHTWRVDPTSTTWITYWTRHMNQFIISNSIYTLYHWYISSRCGRQQQMENVQQPQVHRNNEEIYTAFEKRKTIITFQHCNFFISPGAVKPDLLPHFHTMAPNIPHCWLHLRKFHRHQLLFFHSFPRSLDEDHVNAGQCNYDQARHQHLSMWHFQASQCSMYYHFRLETVVMMTA